MVITSTTPVDHVPGESFFVSCLQKNISFLIDNKIIKKGKLLLFRRTHYFIQITIMSEKGFKENIDIPIPFKIEDYADEGLIYFDYRTKSLEVEAIPRIPEKVTSTYFDKILEIQAA